ncbi:hypothetical protein ACFPIJ_58965 [Dactylosporangium cerinum]|uniref:CBM6 domain-containing protein n=1 Tax=Dactylosporangium cerinum TaxID=1434730 RepID=A0ABV9WGR5_9ACTN
MQILVGGEDNDVDMRVLGLARRGLTGNVRVRVDSAVWTVDPLATDRNVQAGGDWQSAPLNLVDTTMTVDASGALTVPVHRMEGYNGYRILISPAAGPAAYPTKYEAEHAQRVNAAARSGSVVASGGGWVGGIDFADSAVTFTVTAASAGIHTMTVRYANGTTAANATHTVRVNGQPQGSVTYPALTSDYRLEVGYGNGTTATSTHQVSVNGGAAGTVFYPSTGAWFGGPAQDRAGRVAAVTVTLTAGTNRIRLQKGTGFAELDYVELKKTDA